MINRELSKEGLASKARTMLCHASPHLPIAPCGVNSSRALQVMDATLLDAARVDSAGALAAGDLHAQLADARILDRLASPDAAVRLLAACDACKLIDAAREHLRLDDEDVLGAIYQQIIEEIGDEQSVTESEYLELLKLFADGAHSVRLLNFSDRDLPVSLVDALLASNTPHSHLADNSLAAGILAPMIHQLFSSSPAHSDVLHFVRPMGIGMLCKQVAPPPSPLSLRVRRGTS